MSRLHLVSWNVAGWRTALDEITRTTRQGPAATTRKVEEKQNCVATWLERLDADIICLQETKLTSKQVEQDARALCASADGDAWQSFWACNDGKEGQRAGLNGVATFVRNKAFSVVRASARPLGDKELDDPLKWLEVVRRVFLVLRHAETWLSGRALHVEQYASLRRRDREKPQHKANDMRPQALC